MKVNSIKVRETVNQNIKLTPWQVYQKIYRPKQEVKGM